MTTLILRLAGPLQAWGDQSRFTRRVTRMEPTKSGILGMLAAAQGRRRTDPVEDLVKLRFAVRTDQPGRILRDFQTAIRLETDTPMPLSERYYLTDAVFVAGIEGPAVVIDSLAHAIRAPKFPLYLGRRSCVPSAPVLYGTSDSSLETAMTTTPWLASSWFQNRYRGAGFDCALSMDQAEEAVPTGADTLERVRDIPESWDPRRREYAWRNVIHSSVRVECPPRGDATATNHDPWGAL